MKTRIVFQSVLSTALVVAACSFLLSAANVRADDDMGTGYDAPDPTAALGISDNAGSGGDLTPSEGDSYDTYITYPITPIDPEDNEALHFELGVVTEGVSVQAIVYDENWNYQFTLNAYEGHWY